MPIIHDYLGAGHDLSKGAFDSTSITKPGSASKLLNQYLPGKFQESWLDLSKDYRTQLKKYEPTMWKKMWDNFGTKGLMKLFRAGASKYSVGRPIVHKWIAGVAATDPAVGAVVAAAEVGLATVLDTWGDSTTTISAKKGQWIFIESEESHRRRALGKTGFLKSFDKEGSGIEGNLKSIARVEELELKALAKLPPNEKQPPKKKSVSLGFFIEPTAKNRVSVFSMDLGRPLEIEISQMLECDPNVAQRLDEDERLSTLREIFFYKYEGMATIKPPPSKFFLDRRVLYDGESYILLYSKDGKSLLEDGNGKTIVVDTLKLSRDFGDSTKGETDDGFIVAGRDNLYSGQWVFCPARTNVAIKVKTSFELGVIHKIAPDGQCVVYYAIDGVLVYVDDGVIEPLNKHFQELYNAKNSFKLFRLAAIKGTAATRRFALGVLYTDVCTGKDYTDALTTESPFDSEKYDTIVYGEKDEEEEGPDAGNVRKEQVSIQDELRAKGFTGPKEEITDLEYVTERDSIAGTVIVGVAVIVLVYALYAA